MVLNGLCAKVRGAVAIAVAAAPAKSKDPRVRGDVRGEVVLFRMPKKLPADTKTKPTN